MLQFSLFATMVPDDVNTQILLSHPPTVTGAKDFDRWQFRMEVYAPQMNEKVASAPGCRQLGWGLDPDLDTETGPPPPRVHLPPRAHHQKLVTGNFSLHFIMKVVNFLSQTNFSFLMGLTPVQQWNGVFLQQPKLPPLILVVSAVQPV